MSKPQGLKGHHKRQRKHKVSLGIGGARRHRLTELEKVCMGKGLFRSFRPIGSVVHPK